MTRIDNGACVPCVSSPNCSVNQFNLTQSGNAVIANFNVSGVVRDSGMIVSTFTGSFGQIFNNQTISGLLAQVGRAGFIDSAYDGNFAVSAVPEPGTTSLMALGGLITAIRVYRRRRAS